MTWLPPISRAVELVGPDTVTIEAPAGLGFLSLYPWAGGDVVECDRVGPLDAPAVGIPVGPEGSVDLSLTAGTGRVLAVWTSEPPQAPAPAPAVTDWAVEARWDWTAEPSTNLEALASGGTFTDSQHGVDWTTFKSGKACTTWSVGGANGLYGIAANGTNDAERRLYASYAAIFAALGGEPYDSRDVVAWKHELAAIDIGTSQYSKVAATRWDCADAAGNASLLAVGRAYGFGAVSQGWYSLDETHWGSAKGSTRIDTTISGSGWSSMIVEGPSACFFRATSDPGDDPDAWAQNWSIGQYGTRILSKSALASAQGNMPWTASSQQFWWFSSALAAGNTAMKVLSSTLYRKRAT